MSRGRLPPPFDRTHLHTSGYMDTTYTKLFVGGLAWDTQRDTMRHYFQQFGEIQEAVVITDKNTGRSKGYGFVTFKDPDAAMRACQNPAPVIDGRRANCNLAFFGATHNTPHGRFRTGSALVGPGPSVYQPSPSSYFHQPTGHYTPIQYSSYGYNTAGYTQDPMYPMSYYGIYGGQQYSPYYTTGASGGGTAGAYTNYYPLYSPASQGQGFGLQYPLHYLPPRYASPSPGILSLPPSTFTPTSSESITISSRTQNSDVTVAAATQVIRAASGQSSSN